jgi:RNase P subunit RPR2
MKSTPTTTRTWTTVPARRPPRPRGSQQAQRTCADCSVLMVPGQNWWPRARVGRSPTPYVCRPCERRNAAQYATTIERRYSTAQYQARKRGVPWCLSFATYKDLLTPNVCSCCAGPLSPTGSGLDRIDTTKPYETANVVPICGSCRAVRGFALSLEETKLIVERRRLSAA